MATRWVTVNMVQSRPFDTGALDTAGRIVFSFNAIVTRVPSLTFEEEAVTILTDAAVGVFGTTLFRSSKATIPTGAGPYLSVISTGGAPPINVQNVAGIGYERASLQIIVRGVEELATRTMAQAAFDALAVVHDQVIAA